MNPADALMLRPARLDEAQAMAEMSRDLIEFGLGWRYTPGRIAALIKQADATALVAHDPAGVQGFAIMQFGDEQAHLILLCVRPARRRRGIGRCLHEWLLESARVAGMAAIQLELRADNAAALAFYRHLGFTEGLTVPDYYEGRLAARRMVRHLRPQAAAS